MTPSAPETRKPSASHQERQVAYICEDLFFHSKLDVLIRESGCSGARLVLPPDWTETPPQISYSVIAVIVDLELRSADPARVIKWIRSKFPDLPVVAFGPHVKKDELQAASDAGATHSWPRSRLVRELAPLLQMLAVAGDK